MTPRVFPVALGILFLSVSLVYAQEPLVLLAPTARTAQPLSRDIVRQRHVDAPGAARLITNDSRVLRLDLFPDVTLRVTRTRLETNARGGSWIGVVDGVPRSDVVIVQVDGELRGSVYTPFGLFRIARDGSGYVVQQIDAAQEEATDDAVVPPEEPAADTRDIAPALSGPDNGGLIDVMIVYTADALAGFTSETSARAAFELAVAETNQAFRNSLIDSAVRLVHAQVIEYTETGSSATDLGRLSNRVDGFMDNVHAIRDRFAADLVVLVTERMTDASGRGYLNNQSANGTFGFSVVARRSMATGRTFAHELGHNLGAHHDWFVETSPGVFRSSKGYTSVEGRFLDVMAYFNLCGTLRLACTPGLHYSNPRLMKDGFPAGVPGGTKLTCVANDPNQVDCDADAAGALNTMARVVARFRQGSASLMSAGQQLGPNEAITSDGGAFRLVYQGDGNLVLYDLRAGAAVWATHTSGTLPGRLVMQNDGNLVLYDGSGAARWASGTNGSWFSYLLVQNDGNLVIYSPNGPAVWDRFAR